MSENVELQVTRAVARIRESVWMESDIAYKNVRDITSETVLHRVMWPAHGAVYIDHNMGRLRQKRHDQTLE